MEYSNIFVCCMGLGLTFIVLICIIILCKLMSVVCNLAKKITDHKKPHLQRRMLLCNP